MISTEGGMGERKGLEECLREEGYGDDGKTVEKEHVFQRRKTEVV